jgi:polysaccharide export outer membrane protein
MMFKKVMWVSLVSLSLALCGGGWAGPIPDKVELRVGGSQKLEVVGLTRFTVDDAKIIKVTKLSPNTLQITAQKDGATYLRVVTEKGTRPILCLVSPPQDEGSAEGNGKKEGEKTPPKTDNDANADNAPAEGEDFLQPGDVIALNVLGEDNLSKTYQVNEQGFITMPLLDKVRAAGLTPTQLKQKLTKELAKFLVDPDVKVTLEQRPERAVGTVSIFGQVERQGIYPIKRGEQRKVIEWLVQAGIKPSADISRVQLTRESVSKEARTLNLKRLYDEGNPVDNILILPGDVLFVPELQKVTVMGAVERPGMLQISGGVLLYEVITQAGGFLPSADWRRVEITRASGSKITVNVLSAIQDGNPAGNPVIQPGDSIFVPHLKAIRVIGAVQKAGIVYTPEERVSVVALLDKVGGHQPTADLTKAQIIRESGEQPLAIDLGAILQGKQPSVDLQPGDTLFVPIGASVPGAGNANDPLAVTVYGQVRQRGVVKLTGETPLLNLLQDVGAVDNENADLEKVEVTFRDGTKKTVNVDQLLRTADPEQDIKLNGGERIYVPKLSMLKNSFYVTGGVARPGIYKFEKDMTMFQGILMAGGAAKYSKKDVSVMRMNPETKKVEQLTFDFQKIKKGEAEDPKLQPGDVVYVGEGKPPFNWGQALGMAGQAAMIFWWMGGWH